jgi:hypothetical protein
MHIFVGRGRIRPAFMKIVANLGITKVKITKNAIHKKPSTKIGY